MINGRPEMGDRIPPEWRPAERYITTCARCGCEMLKSNGIALYRQRKGSTMQLLLHFCVACYTNFLDDYGIGE